jgi:hypothetical protein
LKDRNFVIVSVALDTGGVAAVRDWIRPGEPVEIPPPLRDIMGWSAEQCRRAMAPTYPCLIDEKHVVAELYNMTNVPMAVWIDESSRVVRPVEPAGVTDGFRSMDRSTFQMDSETAEKGRVARKRYVDALRDWVDKGDSSVYALPPDETRTRVTGLSETDALAATNFRLGQYLRQRGFANDARRYFSEAKRLCPERWNYVRQALELEETGKASGPDFFAAVDALGDRPYYPPVVFESTRK